MNLDVNNYIYNDPHDDFRDAIRSAGLEPPQHIERGRIHRFPGAGKGKRNTAGWCRLFDDGLGGRFGDWSTGLDETWQAKREHRLRPALRPIRKVRPAMPPPAPSRYAIDAWHRGGSDVSRHPYARSKGITWQAGARRGRISGRVVGKDTDCILVPICDITSGELYAVQSINANGAKQTFGPLKGHGLILGNDLNRSIPWYVAEGWATGISIVFHHQGGNACCGVAFGKSNMDTLADAIEAAYKPRRLDILLEVDQ